MYYFINKEHETAFNDLMRLYNFENFEDCQYEASIYIASVPDIHKCLPETINTLYSPIYSLMTYDEDQNTWDFTAQGLTGSTLKLCQFALSLFNGYKVDMNTTLGTVTLEEYVLVMFQAMKIRAYGTFY